MLDFSRKGDIMVFKHYLLFIPIVIKFIFTIFFVAFLTYIAFLMREYIGDDLFHYVFFPLNFVILNYAFFRLIFGLIEYYNNILILKDEHIISINSTFILRDDIEIIEAYKVIKIDLFSRGFFANILSFGTVVIELQTKEQREFYFIPRPYKIINYLKAQREYVLRNRGKVFGIEEQKENDLL